jgi:hypothetical protein
VNQGARTLLEDRHTPSWSVARRGVNLDQGWGGPGRRGALNMRQDLLGERGRAGGD